MPGKIYTDLFMQMAKKVAHAVEETIGLPVRYVCLPAGTVLNGRTRE